MQRRFEGGMDISMKNTVIKLDEEYADEFWRLRMDLLKELGETNAETDIFKLESASKQYYLAHINKDLICWGIKYESALVATGSLCLFQRIPYKENLVGLEGYILNIYTAPDFRRKGRANDILDEIISYASQIHVKRLWLNSSEYGKNLYSIRGFTIKDNEMELFL